MYEDMTYEAILADGKAQISDGILKSEGSLVHNALSAMAYELSKLYIQARYLMDQIDPDAADYENLVKMCKQRGIYPADATAATVKIVANTDVPIGSRFSLNIFNYTITETIEGEAHSYKALCETAGSAANTIKGALTPITHIEGLTNAVITDILIEGEDATTQEELLKEYKDSFVSGSFGGNVTQYKEEVNKIDGIGGCKVFPVWNGGGTVKVVAVSANYNVVSEELIQTVQEAICPKAGSGYGTAPIGHDVTVVSATAKAINITTNITYTTGESWDTLGEKITAAIEAYLLSLRSGWADGSETDFLTVYASRIEARILEVSGVLDAQNTMVNGSTSKAELTWDEIPTLGEIIHD